jgi:prephenate dehydrogenase
VAVLGLGVIGGSVARGLSDVGVAERVIGWSPESTERDAALTARAITFGAAEWPQAVEDADLVVLATPLAATLDIMASLPEAAPDAAITDVAGLKLPVALAASEAGLSDRWVGSHPMAGSERSGFWASRADLFQGARVWLVSEGAEKATYGRVRRLWTAVGAAPAEIEAWEHDRLMAVASHLPQLVANALADVMPRSGPICSNTQRRNSSRRCVRSDGRPSGSPTTSRMETWSVSRTSCGGLGPGGVDVER